MGTKEIIEKLQSGLYDIEYNIENDFLIGALKKKTNPTGLGRFEFVVRGIEEQEKFVEDVKKYLDK
jgi:hypothetical protein